MEVVGRVMHAYSRKRDAQAWASKETVKFAYFCNCLRSLFRDKTIPDTLKNELNLSKEDIDGYAAKVKAAQGQDDTGSGAKKERTTKGLG